MSERRGEIARKLVQLAKESSSMPGAVQISSEAWQEDLGKLAEDLVEAIHLKEGGTTAEALERSRTFDSQRWRTDSNVSELLWEIYLLRQVLTNTVLEDFWREHPEYSETERAESERQIHEFFHGTTCESVERFVEELQRAMLKSHQELQETTDSREHLTRTIAHELRNVVNALTLAIKLLGEEAEKEGRAAKAATCSRMLSDMARILNDLFHYNALIAGHSQLTLDRLSLPELFDELVSEWEPVVEEQGLVLERKCDTALGQIVSDKLKLKQIAGNLILNAIKYRKRTEGGYVGLSFAAYGSKSWKMVVVDTGIGITQEDMASLFGEFGQVRSITPVPGTGLGLAICKEFAELLGGHVDVRSEPQGGTRFEVTFPLREEVHSKEWTASSPQIRDEIASSGQPHFQIL